MLLCVRDIGGLVTEGSVCAYCPMGTGYYKDSCVSVVRGVPVLTSVQTNASKRSV